MRFQSAQLTYIGGSFCKHVIIFSHNTRTDLRILHSLFHVLKVLSAVVAGVPPAAPAPLTRAVAAPASAAASLSLAEGPAPVQEGPVPAAVRQEAVAGIRWWTLRDKRQISTGVIRYSEGE